MTNKNFRVEAEQKLSSDLSDKDYIGSNGDFEALIHELRVHQIELELQNDALREAQIAQEEAERKYFTLFNLAPVGYVVVTVKGVLQALNLTASELLDVNRNNALGKPLSMFFDLEDRPLLYQHLNHLSQTQNQHAVRLRLLSQKKRPLVVVHIVSQLFEENGEQLCRMTLTNVTEEYLLVQEQIRQKQRYEAIFNYSHNVIMVFDANLKYVEGNPLTQTLLGYSRYNKNLHINDVLGENWYENHLAEILRRGSITGTATLENHAGKQLIFEYRFVYKVLVDSHTLILSDVTQEYLARQELEESEYRFRKMADDAPVLVWIADTTKACTFFNQRWLDFTGRTLEQEIDYGWMESVHPDDLERCMDIYQTAFTHQQSFESEYRLRRHDGVYRWVLERGMPRYSPDGIFEGYIGSCIDISEIYHHRQLLQRSNQELEENIDFKEDLLRQREAMLTLLTTNANDLICLHAPDGTYQYVSSASQHLLGYAPEQLLGRNPYELLAPEEYDRIRAFHEEAVSSETKNMLLTARHRHADGHYIWLETVSRVVSTDEDDIAHIVSISRDVTERKRYEEKLQNTQKFLQAVIDVYPSHIAVLDEMGTIISVNQQWRDYGEANGASKAVVEGEGINFLELCRSTKGVGVEDANNVADIVESIIEQSMDRYVYEYSNKDAVNERWYSLRLTSFVENGLPRILLSYTDVTDQKILEQSIRQALAHEQELNRIKSDFITTVSHEFKTPLAMIQSSKDMLVIYEDRLTEERKAEKFETIQRSITRLNQLLSDTIELERINRNASVITPETIKIAPFCKTIIRDLEGAMSAQNRIQLSIAPTIQELELDRGILSKIFSNLLSNALKYSDDTVFLHIQILDDTLSIIVKDRGIGIPADQKDNLFTGFFRAKNVGSIPGTGLGLTIVKNAVDLYHGEISLESEENGGTTIQVLLPLN